MKTIALNSLLSLLEHKGISTQARRRLVVTQVALELIEVSLSTDNTTTSLAGEMQNLPNYVAAIEALLEGGDGRAE